MLILLLLIQITILMKTLGVLNGLVVTTILLIGLILLCRFSLKMKLPKSRYSRITWEDMPWLYDGIARMANRARIQTPTIYIEDNPIPIAYSFQNSIVLSAGLFEILDRDEILAVAAHEIGHIKNGDTFLFPLLRYGKYVMGIMTLITVFIAKNSLTSLISVGVFLTYMVTLLRFLRKREFKADRIALQIAEVPYALKTALEELKFYEESMLGKDTPLPTIQPSLDRKENNYNQQTILFSTHPTYEERIAKIMSIVDMYRRLELLK
ncbi:Heat shock protein/ Zn-dependent protease with chaperone function, M48 family [Pyrococcus abyssi GE5]|uniref:Heat shock protein n=2 Tax=Pyrococcus abyssi TaxID=29292 RepID=Q9V155_PYRAB|nr:M48 family metallopeptidase [Pyrococcus abyssi]CAB49496.1 Heat shock protein/ Zn-dependent protease with chaperone function, M48 family [Pyrococcus abyssi GE5]CCE69966.1 TPA: heat shock protein [Pyrococcus abyssi GE5]